MNYTILSNSGWRAKASTIQRAHELAVCHKQEWKEVGREIQVSIFYYDGTLVEQF